MNSRHLHRGPKGSHKKMPSCGARKSDYRERGSEASILYHNRKCTLQTNALFYKLSNSSLVLLCTNLFSVQFFFFIIIISLVNFSHSYFGPDISFGLFQCNLVSLYSFKIDFGSISFSSFLFYIYF